ncbi:MAG: FAD-dependent oxidoreductase [Microcoleaceae cyanobacterium]
MLSQFIGLLQRFVTRGFGVSTGLATLLCLIACQPQDTAPTTFSQAEVSRAEVPSVPEPPDPIGPTGRPQLSPLPPAQQVWNCEVVVIGGSLGGIAAAGQAMTSGATTCLIELTPWLGGQISSQGVSAVDESLAMRSQQNYSQSWRDFKQVVEQQPVQLPTWLNTPSNLKVADINACWVGHLCFPPNAGANAAEQWLKMAATSAPASQWGTSIAFKGAEFDATGQRITAIHAVQRRSRQSDYAPTGRFSQEIAQWYAWSANETFEKIPLRLQAPEGKRLLVIDATDTGEFVGWANLPHRLGSESQATTGEVNASEWDNPQCTQAFTYPFVLAIHDDQGKSLSQLQQLQPTYNREEHRRDFSLGNTPVFSGRSFFHYRRIVSMSKNDPFTGIPAAGDLTMVNWNPGNDWGVMNPPLLLTAAELDEAGQRQNWMGGMAVEALGHGEDRALLFAEWLVETLPESDFPLTYLAGADTPMGSRSGLSIVPYIREGRRILGRGTAAQDPFILRESDVRSDLPGGRDFSNTVVAVNHYDLDIHGCRYRNWEPSGEATSAPAREFVVRPIQIPLESLIPQGVDNLLIGGKGIAVTHIVNAATRVHYGEWGIGSAAGAIAGWLTQEPSELMPADIIPAGRMPEVQQHLQDQGLRLEW